MDDSTILNVEVRDGVLLNDRFASGMLHAELVTEPTHGALVLYEDGSFVYTPVVAFVGQDSFVYRAVAPGFSSASATVTIAVTNEKPVATDVTFFAQAGTQFDESLQGCFADLDLVDELLIQLVNAPLNGTLSLNTDGSFRYTPVGSFIGTDSFTYSVSDGTTHSDTKTVTLVVQGQLPKAVNLNYEVGMNQELSPNPERNLIYAAVENIGRSGLTVEILAAPAQAFDFVPYPDGTFKYIPNIDYQGVDTFIYRVNQGDLKSEPAVVTLTVRNQSILRDDAYLLPAQGDLEVSLAHGVFGNDLRASDFDPNQITIEQPEHGSLEFRLDGSFVYRPDANQIRRDVSFAYSLPATPGVPIRRAVVLILGEAAGMTVALLPWPESCPQRPLWV
jgi:hypothetical protein